MAPTRQRATAVKSGGNKTTASPAMGHPGIIKPVLYGFGAPVVIYFLFLSLLTIPSCQNQIIYLNRVIMTWFRDVNFPEQWGFLHNQVTPFNLRTSDGETLHAWHILPLGLYRRYEPDLVHEPSGLAPDIEGRLGFKLLRDDPDSLLVLYLHGAAGTLGSGWRPPSYRAIYSGAPDKIHVVSIDYRGFGTSTGVPSEDGLLTDAITLADWAMTVAGIPPERIVLFGQSLGTAVGISLAHHMATRGQRPALFAGMVLVAPFSDVELLTATYRVAGTIPLLEPVARFPRLLAFLNTFIVSKWPSKDKLAAFVRHCEGLPDGGGGGGGGGDGGTSSSYHINIIHAQDDYDIPWTHSEMVFWHAVNASLPAGISFKALEEDKLASRRDLGAGGLSVERRMGKGLIREDIAMHGLHDRIMSYPVVTLAVLRAFHGRLGPDL